MTRQRHDDANAERYLTQVYEAALEAFRGGCTLDFVCSTQRLFCELLEPLAPGITEQVDAAVGDAYHTFVISLARNN